MRALRNVVLKVTLKNIFLVFDELYCWKISFLLVLLHFGAEIWGLFSLLGRIVWSRKCFAAPSFTQIFRTIWDYPAMNVWIARGE